MITLKDIKNAKEYIADIAKETPIFSSKTLSSICQNQVWIKGEHIQTTGSFKIRGATNKVKKLAEAGVKQVIAASSGNHGQAVAYVAQALGLKATIVVPEDATTAKVDAIKNYGAEVIYCGTTSHERIDRAIAIAEAGDAEYVPPYDDPFIMAGQGTVGLEILDQVENVDVVYVPIGGGGLLSGTLTAIKESRPNVKVIGVEPRLANDTFLSFKKGEPISVDATATIADGLRSSQPGELTFPVLQKYLDDVVLVEENDIRKAFTFLLQRMKQVVEPSGAVSVAAMMGHAGRTGEIGQKILAVASGGNVALDKISELIVPLD